MNRSKTRNELFKHYFKELTDFSIEKIKMFEILDETPSSVFLLFSFLKNESLEEIMLSPNDVIFYCEKISKLIPEGERMTILTKSKSEKDHYVITIATKNDDKLNVVCNYPEEPLLLEKGEKIIVMLNKKSKR